MTTSRRPVCKAGGGGGENLVVRCCLTWGLKVWGKIVILRAKDL